MEKVKKPLPNAAKIALLALTWAAATVVMQLITESRWWLAAIGGAGLMSLVLSFTLPEGGASAKKSDSG